MDGQNWRITVEKEHDKAGWTSQSMARTGGTKQRGLERQRDGVKRLLAWRATMILCYN